MKFIFDYPSDDLAIKYCAQEIADDLFKIYQSQGASFRRIASKLKWPPSKATKLNKHDQKATVWDCRNMALQLGFTIAMQISNPELRQEYLITNQVRPLSDQMVDLRTDPFSSDRDQVMICEYPPAIVNLLGIRAVDYYIRSEVRIPSVKEKNENMFSGNDYILSFRNLNVPDDDIIFYFGFVIDPSRKTVLFSVWAESRQNGCLYGSKRRELKERMQSNQDETNKFEEYASQNESWLPEIIKFGEIDSLILDIADITDENTIESHLINLFKAYSILVLDYTGADVLTPTLRTEAAIGALEMDQLLHGTATFPSNVINAVKRMRGYRCDVDSSHETFLDNDGNPYVEVVPLLPFINQMKYGGILKSEVNALCLCPMCASKFENGRKIDREDMLSDFYRKNRDKLHSAGVEIGMRDLLDMHSL